MFKRKRDSLQCAEDFLKRAAAGVSADSEIQVNKIADEVGISVDRLPSLLEDLEADQVLRREGQHWSLTEKGWAQGRQILRAHRIYESYLAEQTGTHPAEWHSEADRREHELDSETVNRMAAELNRPRFDPHGDAIPTRALEMMKSTGGLLSHVDQDGDYRIVHIEDEPKEPFKQSILAGLAPELIVAVNVLSGGRYHLKWAGLNAQLDSAQAAGLRVCAWAHTDADADELPRGNLYQLAVGRTVQVHSISQAVRGLQRRRLLDLGFVPGSRVCKEGVAAFGGPMRFRIRGTAQALRTELARSIFTKEATGAKE
jgi:DtxR family Mn-dependent transcriptional regulator